MADKLAQLIALCKCSVTVQVNDHRDNYISVARWLEEHDANDLNDRIPGDVQAGMIASDTIVEIFCYPRTPVGQASIVHYSLDAALDAMLEAMK